MRAGGCKGRWVALHGKVRQYCRAEVLADITPPLEDERDDVTDRGFLRILANIVHRSHDRCRRLAIVELAHALDGLGVCAGARCQAAALAVLIGAAPNIGAVAFAVVRARHSRSARLDHLAHAADSGVGCCIPVNDHFHVQVATGWERSRHTLHRRTVEVRHCALDTALLHPLEERAGCGATAQPDVWRDQGRAHERPDRAAVNGFAVGVVHLRKAAALQAQCRAAVDRARLQRDGGDEEVVLIL